MKYLRLLLCVSLLAFGATAVVAEDVDSKLPETSNIAVAKKTDSTATVYLSSKDSVTTPIKFADGASWDNVRDNYTVPADYVSLLRAGKACITIKSDGTAVFGKTSCPAPKSKK